MHKLQLAIVPILVLLLGLGASRLPALEISPAGIGPERFGAAGDGIHDDGAALTAAAKSFKGSGGIIQLDCSRRYRIDEGINLAQHPGVIVRGCLAFPDDPGTFRGYAGGLSTFGGILRGPRATIVVGRDSGLENVVVLQADLPSPAASVGKFAGTAIATPPGAAGQAAILHNVLVVGAEICFDDNNGGGRVRMDGFYCDGLSGEIIGPSKDTSIITNVHNWPFATLGLEPVLRPGVGLEMRGASDDSVLEIVFDLGHRIGFLFNTAGHGIFHVEHLWADNNADTCVRFAGGRGINVASLTTYTCGVGVDVAKSAEVQISQAFIAGMAHECIRLDGTLSVSLLHLEHCGTDGGIRVTTPGSLLSIGFLHLMTLSTPWAISVPAGFTNDRIGIGKLFTDAPPGSSLYRGTGPEDPVVTAMPTLALPSNGSAFTLDGHGVVRRLRGGWNGRIVTFTTASRMAAVAGGQEIKNGERVPDSEPIALANGSPFGGKAGSVLVLRFDGRAELWREISRTNP